jgi:hypothetical protein
MEQPTGLPTGIPTGLDNPTGPQMGLPSVGSILPALQKLESDVNELRTVVTTIGPTVAAIATALGKVGPAVAEILQILKALRLVP